VVKMTPQRPTATGVECTFRRIELLNRMHAVAYTYSVGLGAASCPQMRLHRLVSADEIGSVGLVIM
jgi:hypothetical protein